MHRLRRNDPAGARSVSNPPGRSGIAVAQPEFDGPEWYEAYCKRTAADGSEGRLVSLFSFAEDWESWGMHPVGDEVVVCLSGRMTLLARIAMTTVLG